MTDKQIPSTGSGVPEKPSHVQPVFIDGAPYTGEPLIKYEAVAEYAGLSVVRIQQLVRERKIPYYKIGASVRFRLSEIDKWLNARRMGTTAKKE